MLLLSGVHLLASKLRFLDLIPRSRWLSFAGGVSIAYVFVHILPDLHVAQHALERASRNSVLEFVEAHAYLVALTGVGVFYGLEHLAVSARHRNHAESGRDETPAGVFWVHILSYAIYNILIGYLLLHREEPGTKSLLFFALAIGMHFVINDYGLGDHHRV
jgi:zinc transporter ZupT